MMKKRISRYIYTSLVVMLSCVTTRAQVDTTRYGGLRLSLNLGSGIGWFTTPKQPGIEATFDAEIKDGWFIVAEGGQGALTLDKYNYKLGSNGLFLRLGFNRNFLKRNYNENEIIFWGLRLAGSRFVQQADNILLTDNYWGDQVTSVPKETIQAYWFEVTAGIRAELFPNFFIGWGVSTRLFLHLSAHQIAPYYIPGYGKTIKSSSMGFQYIIAYRIPFQLK